MSGINPPFQNTPVSVDASSGGVVDWLLDQNKWISRCKRVIDRLAIMNDRIGFQ